MLDALISLLAPHSCVSCSRTGGLLCHTCKHELIEARVTVCISCGKLSMDGLCEKCASRWPVEHARVFGERSDVLKTLIDEYKYANKRAAHRELARLASVLLPYGSDAVVVPVPTISRHIRERGYDHMSLLARRVARLNRLTYAPLLIRQSDSVQHGATKRERLRQAETAFAVRRPLDPEPLYIVLDDITTTGASLKAAARVLWGAGAQHIWAVALARQPLE